MLSPRYFFHIGNDCKNTQTALFYTVLDNIFHILDDATTKNKNVNHFRICVLIADEKRRAEYHAQLVSCVSARWTSVLNEALLFPASLTCIQSPESITHLYIDNVDRVSRADNGYLSRFSNVAVMHMCATTGNAAITQSVCSILDEYTGVRIRVDQY